VNFKGFVRAWAFGCGALLLSVPASAQEEAGPVVLDQVIAQVNDQVVTLSMLKRTMKEAADAIKQQRGITDQQAMEEVTKRQPEIIATLINEELLVQKGKELGLSDEVEAQVNKQMLAAAKGDANIKTMEDLNEAMKQSGLDPEAIRQTLRTETMKNAVLGHEVDAKIYYGLTSEEIKKYYEAHKEKFAKPETVTLSEIFLSLAGKNEADVRAKSQQLVAEARGGANFGELAAANSEREENGQPVAPQTKGKLGTFQVPEITRQDVATAIKNLKAGGVTDPIRTDEGYIILRVDERTAAGGATFNENQVREAMTYERADKEHEAYLSNLRKEAYINVAKDYQDAVLPLLKLNAPATASAATSTPAPAAKNSKKKPQAYKP